MASPEVVELELKRLKKDDLIKLLVLKKVLNDVVLSDKVIEYILGSKKEEKISEIPVLRPEEFSNLKEKQEELTIMSLKYELRIAKLEAESSKRLVLELERSVNNQELVINLLKKDNNAEIIRQAVPVKSTIESGNVKSLTNKVELTSKSSQKQDQGETSVSHIQEQTPAITSRKTPITPVVWGNNEDSLETQGSSFAAATRRAWLYVGKVEKTTQAEQIKKYLENRFQGFSFLVEQLTGHETANSASFKVGADYSLLDDLNNPSVWPKGVAIKRFMFF